MLETAQYGDCNSNSIEYKIMPADEDKVPPILTMQDVENEAELSNP